MKDKSTKNTEICKRYPFWQNDGLESIFCCLHLPKDNQISTAGIVICNPLGFEYTHSHRTVRHLADNLSCDGFATIRFDYHGTGDSFSDLFEPQRVKTFLENIDAVIKRLKQQTGVTKICLIGIRLGAALAATYCNNKTIDKLVLWTPCISGRRYIRELKAFEKLASHSSNTQKSFIDSGGFFITDETADEIKAIDLTKQNYNVTQNALIIDRDDLKPNTDLVTTLKEGGIKQVEHYFMSGYLDMMTEPQDTKIPNETIDHLSDWLKKQVDYLPLNNLDIDLEETKTLDTASHDGLVEQICYPDEEKLMGIFSHQDLTTQKTQTKPLILLVNSGTVHKVGPNRVYVELSRALADNGYPVIRFDLSNLGGSVIGRPHNENHPYPSNATQNIADLISYMKEHFGFNKFIIAGLCSGAHNVFHAGMDLPLSLNIQEVIMINPLSFYRVPDADIEATLNYQVERDSQQYARSIFDLKKWKKLFSGQSNIGYLFTFTIRKFLRSIHSFFLVTMETLGLYSGTQLSIDLKKYARKGMKISFFIASKDPGKDILMTQAKKTVLSMKKSKQLSLTEISNADHTFSSFSCRKDFIHLFVKHIKSSHY
jgi:pimeloyl-ACP methyl ester carboxylesterase